jgi:hypothetical protein
MSEKQTFEWFEQIKTGRDGRNWISDVLKAVWKIFLVQLSKIFGLSSIWFLHGVRNTNHTDHSVFKNYLTI